MVWSGASRATPIRPKIERTNPFGLAEGQVEYEPKRERSLDGDVGVLPLAATSADGLCVPAFDGVGSEPDGEIAATDERTVVLGPVGDAVLGLVLRVDAGTLARDLAAPSVDDGVIGRGGRVTQDSCTNAT